MNIGKRHKNGVPNICLHRVKLILISLGETNNSRGPARRGIFSIGPAKLRSYELTALRLTNRNFNFYKSHAEHHCGAA